MHEEWLYWYSISKGASNSLPHLLLPTVLRSVVPIGYIKILQTILLLEERLSAILLLVSCKHSLQSEERLMPLFASRPSNSFANSLLTYLRVATL